MKAASIRARDCGKDRYRYDDTGTGQQDIKTASDNAGIAMHKPAVNIRLKTIKNVYYQLTNGDDK